MARNIFFNILSLASTIALGFVISPMILRSLGDARYGVWALFGEMLVYLGLMDFGIRGSVSYFVGKSITAENRPDIERYMSSAFAGLLGIGTTIYAIVLGLIFVFERQLMRNYTDRTDVVVAAAIFAGLFCFGFPLEVFSAAVTGSRQRYRVSTAEIASRTFSAALMFVVLKTSPSLIGLALSQLGGRLLYWGLNYANARKYVPGARIHPKLATWKTIREILDYSTKASLLDIARLFGDRKDVLLTTTFLGPSRVPTFSFARQFTTLLMNACSSITQAIRPNLVHHWTLGEKEIAFGIYYTIARYAGFVVAMGAAFLCAFGRDFISLWIGERFVTGDPRFRTDLILFVLLAGYVPRAMNSISTQILLATRSHQSLSKIIIADTAVNLLLSFLLIRPYGTLGLAIASTAPALVTQVILVPNLLSRKVGVSRRRYWMEGVGPAILVALAALVVGLLSRQVIGGQTWLAIAQGGALMGVTGLVLAYFFLLRPEHRDRLTGMVRGRLAGGTAA